MIDRWFLNGWRESIQNQKNTFSSVKYIFTELPSAKELIKNKNSFTNKRNTLLNTHLDR